MTPRFVLGTAWLELRDGLRSGLVPLLGALMIGYEMITLVVADYVRQMGGADVARNSAHLVHHMSSGQMFWLLFAWAYVFAQPVVRDRSVGMHEIVLAAPIPLRGLLLARFAGAYLVAVLLGAGAPFGFLLVPLLASLGLVPADSIAATPWTAMTVDWLLFILPSALGLGALYFTAALYTRSTRGAFLVSIVVVSSWMFAMVTLRGADVDPAIATLLDPTVYAEVEEQTFGWTPVEKSTALLALTPPLVLNRLLWTLVPLIPLGISLWRIRREDLILDRPTRLRSTEAPIPLTPAPPLPGPLIRPSWIRATLAETRWQLQAVVGNRALLTAAGVIAVMGIASASYHMIGHADGPFVPYPHRLLPFLVESFYVLIAFIAAAAVGAAMRRDDLAGFGEMLDATCSPLSVRIVGRVLAIAGLTTLLALVPSVSAWALLALTAPHAFTATEPVIYLATVFAPVLFELAALVVLVHAAVRSPGLATGLSMFVVFVLIVNHEATLVSYPPAQIGMPVSVALSELDGWAPWSARLATGDLVKLATCGVVLGLAALVWPRGTDLRPQARVRTLGARVRGAAGAWILACGLVLAAGAAMLHHQLVVRGSYASSSTDLAERASWERDFLPRATPWRASGGTIHTILDPSTRQVRSRLRLDEVWIEGTELHAELPLGLVVEALAVDGRATRPQIAHDHLVIPTGPCAPCAVEIAVVVDWGGWPPDDTPPHLTSSSAWIQLEQILPRLGLDPQRRILAPADRAAHGLSEVPAIDAGAAVPLRGIASHGSWSWEIEAPTGSTLGASQRWRGPLDAAALWLSAAPTVTRARGHAAWHGPTRGYVAGELLEDLDFAQQCAEVALPPTTLVQAPRGSGAIRSWRGMIWIPEDQGWDLVSSGVGRTRRRLELIRALVQADALAREDLRDHPGARWLTLGHGGARALRCIRQRDGVQAWRALVARMSDRVSAGLAATDVPIGPVIEVGDADWLGDYAALAVASWIDSTGPGEAERRLDEALRALSTHAPLAPVLGARADLLLGPPLASDAAIEDGVATGLRWRWRHGGWVESGGSDSLIALSPGSVRLIPAGPIEPTDEAVLDAWPSFERTPIDNGASHEPR